MDLEKLKCCAEALGLNPMVTTEGVYVNYFHDLGTKKYGVLNQEYDPENNDAQAFELLKWLVDLGWDISKEHDGYIAFNYSNWNLDNFQEFRVVGQTLNQAVIEAVWEVKK